LEIFLKHKKSVYENVLSLIVFLLLLPWLLPCKAYSQEKIKLGVLIPLSGNFAPIGRDYQQGVEAALRISGEKELFELVYADSKAEPNTAISEFRKLVSANQVSAILTIRSPVGMALNPLSLREKVALLGGVGDKRFAETNSYAIQAWTRSDTEGIYIANRIFRSRYKKLALITSQDDWTKVVSEDFKTEYLKHANIELEKEVLPTETDFRAIISKLKQKNTDAVFINLGLAQIGPFLRQARELKFSVPFYSNYWVAKKEIAESAGAENIEGVKYFEMDTNLKHLNEDLSKNYNTNASGATLSAYVSTMLVIQAIDSASSVKNKVELYDAVMKQKEIITPDYNYKITNRCVEFPMVERVVLR
jgi:branched-chain amino acid transport system substrate-binding protein